MKLHITKLIRKDTDKEGKPLVTKQGKPYTRLGMQTQEYATKWLSGFASDWNAGWKEGDTVEADVEVSGDFLNVKKPDPVSEMSKVIMTMALDISLLKKRVEALEAEKLPRVAQVSYDSIPVHLEPEVSSPDLPF